MHKRNLIISFFLFLLIAISVMIYSASKEVVPKTVTSKSGYVTLDLDSSYRDNYSASKSPKEILLLQQSKRDEMTVMVAGSVASPDERGLTLKERADKIRQDLAEEKRLISLAIENDEIFYTMRRTDDTISTSRLIDHAGTTIVTSVISTNDADPKKIRDIISSVRYHFQE